MVNEIVPKNLDFSVEFKQSKITVANKEQFESAIKNYAGKYAGLVIDPNNVKDAKDVRAKMNTVVGALDDKRKEIKREFNQPLAEFEAWVKIQKDEIQNVIVPIDQGIKEMEAHEQEERREKLMLEIAEIAPNYGVKVDELTINPSWANKGYFTTKGKLNKKALNEIVGEMKFVKSQKDQLATNKTLIANYAKAVDLEPESWVLQIENGASPQDLMKQIDQVIKAKKERLEEEKKQKEYETAITELNKAEVNGKVIDQETGEIIDRVNTKDLPFGDDDDPFPIEPPVIETLTLRLSAPSHLIQQATQYLSGLGIKIERLDE